MNSYFKSALGGTSCRQCPWTLVTMATTCCRCSHTLRALQSLIAVLPPSDHPHWLQIAYNDHFPGSSSSTVPTLSDALLAWHGRGMVVMLGLPCVSELCQSTVRSGWSVTAYSGAACRKTRVQRALSETALIDTFPVCEFNMATPLSAQQMPVALTSG